MGRRRQRYVCTRTWQIFTARKSRISEQHCVAVHKDDNGYRIDLTGEITHMLKLAAGSNGVLDEPYSSSVKVVAGRGFEPLTFRL